MIEFEWDERKAQSNLQKHGVDFNEAVTVFDDPFAKYFDDYFHSLGEERFIVIGYSQYNTLLVVNFTNRNQSVRIISSRKATKKEKKFYEVN